MGGRVRRLKIETSGTAEKKEIYKVEGRGHVASKGCWYSRIHVGDNVGLYWTDALKEEGGGTRVE